MPSLQRELGRNMSMMPPRAPGPLRNHSALHKVREDFHHWRHNEFDCANSEYEIAMLINAVDRALSDVDGGQQVWDAALGDVSSCLHMLQGLALVGSAES